MWPPTSTSCCPRSPRAPPTPTSAEGGSRRSRGRGRGGQAARLPTRPATSRPSKATSAQPSQQQPGPEQPAASDSGDRQQQADDGDGRSSRSRYRDRKRGRGGQNDDFEPEISDDDVLIPVAGILDVLDNYAFVRTSGYLPGPNDVYVSLGQVKKYNLRKGDAVVGAIRQPREGEQAGQPPEVQRDRQDRLGQRQLDRVGGRARRVRQADPDLPERAPAPRDRAGQAVDPHHRPDRRRSARASAA